MSTIALNDTTVIIGSMELGSMMQNTQRTHLFALALTDGKQLGKFPRETRPVRASRG